MYDVFIYIWMIFVKYVRSLHIHSIYHTLPYIGPMGMEQEHAFRL